MGMEEKHRKALLHLSIIYVVFLENIILGFGTSVASGWNV
jgi:hypothetical protein